MSHPAMSCMSRKGGTEGGGWVHLKSAKCMAVSGLSYRKPSLAPWGGGGGGGGGAFLWHK